MMKNFFCALAIGATAVAVEMPPSIPDGQITYDEVSYQPGASELPAEFISGAAPAVSYDTPVVAPITPAASSTPHTVINLMAYESNYQVRGMGVVDKLSKHGASSLSLSHTFANRNLFRKGIQHRVHGLAGVIWDASCPLGDIMQYELGYSIGKELFPNFLAEVGYNFRRGGLEGYMAKAYDRTSHRSTQDITLSLSYNDYQKGFFGHAACGGSFYGLTGVWFDAELGYRLADVIRSARIGWDAELSVGIAPSVSYWGSGVDGVDAYRVRFALIPYSHGGAFGRDAHTQIKPWVQCAWTGNNSRKLHRHVGYAMADHFQITFGIDIGWKF